MRSAQNVKMRGLKIKVFKEERGEVKGEWRQPMRNLPRKWCHQKQMRRDIKKGKEINRIKSSKMSSEMKAEKLPLY